MTVSDMADICKRLIDNGLGENLMEASQGVIHLPGSVDDELFKPDGTEKDALEFGVYASEDEGYQRFC